MTTGSNTKNNYHAFGMPMPGRSYQSSRSYRYGFNGKENDKETVGTGEGTQDYGDRIYNPSLGRFLSVDPLTKSYPMLTPYSFAEDRPIDGIDLDGREFEHYTVTAIQDGRVTGIKKVNETHSTWVHAAFHRSFGINFEAYKVYTLNYKGANYMFTKHSDMFAPINKLDPKKQPTYEGLQALFNMTDAAGGILAGSMASSKGVRGGVTTPFGEALQSNTPAALKAVSQVEEGVTLYRIGTTGKSKTGSQAQFWSLENPMENPAAYAKKYGVPLDNIKNADFMEIANLKKGSNFVTREAPTAPGAPKDAGGGMEAIIEHGGTTNNLVIPFEKK